MCSHLALCLHMMLPHWVFNEAGMFKFSSILIYTQAGQSVCLQQAFTAYSYKRSSLVRTIVHFREKRFYNIGS
jgi:hypothetical protein